MESTGSILATPRDNWDTTLGHGLVSFIHSFITRTHTGPHLCAGTCVPQPTMILLHLYPMPSPFFHPICPSWLIGASSLSPAHPYACPVPAFHPLWFPDLTSIFCYPISGPCPCPHLSLFLFLTVPHPWTPSVLHLYAMSFCYPILAPSVPLGTHPYPPYYISLPSILAPCCPHLPTSLSPTCPLFKSLCLLVFFLPPVLWVHCLPPSLPLPSNSYPVGCLLLPFQELLLQGLPKAARGPKLLHDGLAFPELLFRHQVLHAPQVGG